MLRRWIVCVAFSTLAFSGCTEAGDMTAENDVKSCIGSKCDGISDKFMDVYDDMKSVDLKDLTVLGVGFASDELNGKLADIPFTSLQLEPVALYGDAEEVFGQTTIYDLNALKSGLTNRLGEKAFATRVAEMRRQLAADGQIWAESRFEIGPDLGTSWGMSHGDTVGSVGFNASATVETVVIAPHDDFNDALRENPLNAIKAARGFVMPRSMSDIAAMCQGESLAMRAEGALGLNMGVGVPFMIATVAELIALHARLSFGARVALAGKLDVQLVRGSGTDAWIDVGLSNQNLRSFSVAATTGFGVQGLPEVNLDLGVVDISIDDLAEKALRKQLNKRIAPKASARTSTTEGRLTVARFKFDLSFGSSDEVEQAMAQAMRGDIRLAQALANRGDSGVVQELDIAKDARSEANYLGFQFLGMEFYRANNFNTGTIRIEADGESQTLLFTEIDQKSGLFFTDRDMSWRKLVSLKSSGGRLTDASVNARITMREKDKFLTRDQMLDHVDSLVGYFIGYDATFETIGSLSDELADFVDNYCGRVDTDSTFQERRDHRECLASLDTLPDVQARITGIEVAVDEVVNSQVRGGFDPSYDSGAKVVTDLLMFKIMLSSLNDRPDVSLDGPEGTMVTQVRFSDDALHTAMVPGRGGDFRGAITEVLSLMAAKRDREIADKRERVADYVDDRAQRIDEMGAMFDEATFRWAELDEIANLELNEQTVGEYGSLVTIPVENPDKLTLANVAEHKGEVIEELVPNLIDLAEKGIFRDLDEPAAFVVGYALLYLVEPSQIELLSSYTFNDDDAPENVQVYSRGTSPLIDAGQFNLEQLLSAQ